MVNSCKNNAEVHYQIDVIFRILVYLHIYNNAEHSYVGV